MFIDIEIYMCVRLLDLVLLHIRQHLSVQETLLCRVEAALITSGELIYIEGKKGEGCTLAKFLSLTPPNLLRFPFRCKGVVLECNGSRV